jgi:hypothetical protein
MRTQYLLPANVKLGIGSTGRGRGNKVRKGVVGFGPCKIEEPRLVVSHQGDNSSMLSAAEHP